MKTKKILALFLALCLTVSLPVNALAAEQDEGTPVEIAGESDPSDVGEESTPADTPDESTAPADQDQTDPEDTVIPDGTSGDENASPEETPEDGKPDVLVPDMSALPEIPPETIPLEDARLSSGSLTGGLSWALDLDLGVLTINGSGGIPDFSSSSRPPWYDDRSLIEEIIIGSGVTGIGANAFADCIGAWSIAIPNTVTIIGQSAFSGCSALENAEIPDSVTSIGASAFYGCSAIVNLTLPSGLTELGNTAFQKCSSIQNVTIPGTVNVIGDSAFNSCTSLTKVNIQAGVKGINPYAFEHCTRLQEITIPKSVTNIGRFAFSDCGRLSTIYYTGRRNQWDSIQIDGWNDNLINARRICEAPAGSTAVSGTVNVTYSVSNGVLTISGTGNMTEYSESARPPWYRQQTDIYEIVVEPGITGISDYAFQGLNAAESVSIPDTVTTIGSYAFDRCSGLTSVTIPDSVLYIWNNAFSNCTGLVSVSLPKNLRTIQNSVFENSSALVNLTLPNGIENIGNTAFQKCSSIQSVTIPGTVNVIGDSAFNSCTSLTKVNIQAGVKGINPYAFEHCTRLQEITIPKSVTNIGRFAFSDCGRLSTVYYTGRQNQWDSIQIDGWNDNLTNARRICEAPADSTAVGGTVNVTYSVSNGVLTISGTGNMTEYSESARPPWYSQRMDITSVIVDPGVTGISDYAFQGLNAAESVSIPDTVTTIGSYAFGGCSGLTSVTIPDSVLYIWNNAFSSCTGLVSVSLPKNLRTIQNSVFESCSALVNLTLPNGIENIGNTAFKKCSSIQSVTIPGTVNVIGDSAFNSCTSLTKVNIQAGVKGINPYAFEHCTRLQEITIPKSVTNIGRFAFSDCGSIRDVYYTGTQTQWNSIQIDGWNDNLTNATIHCNYTPITTVTGITLSRTSLTLEVGQSATLTVTTLPDHGAADVTAWISTDMGVADISNGTVTAKRAGQTTITVHANGYTASCTVTVTDPKPAIVPVTGVSLNATILTLTEGDSGTLTANVLPNNALNQGVTWSSSNTSVAEVSSSGVVTAKTLPNNTNSATATITATTVDGGFTANCTVIVVKAVQTVIPVTGVRLDKNALTLTAGGAMGGTSGVLTATVTPSNATNQNLVWSSSDPSVATVTDGKVFALKTGTTTVTVTTQDGNKTASCAVTVNPVVSQVTGVSLNKTDLRLNAGQKETLTATIAPADASNKAVAWTSSNPAVAEVSENGAVTAKKGGEAVITAITADGGFTASCTVTVQRTMTGIAVTKKPDKIVYNYNEELNTAGMEVSAVYDDGGSETVTGWSVSGYDKTTSGSQTVTVTYQTYTAAFTVTVGEKPVSGTLPKPQMSVKSISGGKQVTLTAPQGKIHYTLTVNGETPEIPTASSEEYTGPITIPATMTLKAIAIQGNSSSNVTSARINVSQAGMPVIFPGGSTVKDGALVTLRTDTTGSDIYYTLDGSDPVPGNDKTRKYNGAVLLREEDADADGQLTLKAIAVKDGYANSGTARTTYTMEKKQRPQNEVTVSLGSVSTKAGAVASVPLYLFSDSDVKSFQITAIYDKDAFENYVTVTPAEGIDASRLFLSNDNGILTLLYTGQKAIESEEVCTLNFTSLVSKANTTYPLNVVPEATTVSSGAEVDVLLSFMNGVIELGDALKMELDASVSYTKKDGAEVTMDNINEGNTEEIEASVSINNPASSDNTTAGTTPSFGNLYLVIYNRYNQMVSVDTWRVDLSEPSFMFLQTIKIPQNVEVGAIKIMLLSDQMVPLMAASELAK